MLNTLLRVYLSLPVKNELLGKAEENNVKLNIIQIKDDLPKEIFIFSNRCQYNIQKRKKDVKQPVKML
jgi:hypothetical protein